MVRWGRVISPLGWTALAAAVVAALVATTLGWAELAAVAIAIMVALVIAVAFVLGRPSYAVSVDLGTTRIVVGDRAVGELRIQGAGRRPVAPSTVELPVGRAVSAFPVPRLAPGEQHDELFSVPTSRRAVLTLGPVRSVRTDPLGLLRRQLDWTEPQEIFVHPRTVRLNNDSTGYLRDLEGFAARELSNDDVSFHALREYVVGDDLRNVHWLSTARTGQLMIRQFEETRRSELVVVVSTIQTDYRDVEEFELALETAASLAVNALVTGTAVRVYTSDARLRGSTVGSLLDAFSGIEPSEAREGFSERARTIAAEEPGASVFALVAGSELPVTDVWAASVRAPLSARCVALRVALAETLGRSTVGGLSLATFPRLADLPLAIRAVTT